MDIVKTCDALRASARSGQVFPRCWRLSDYTDVGPILEFDYRPQ